MGPITQFGGAGRRPDCSHLLSSLGDPGQCSQSVGLYHEFDCLGPPGTSGQLACLLCTLLMASSHRAHCPEGHIAPVGHTVLRRSHCPEKVTVSREGHTDLRGSHCPRGFRPLPNACPAFSRRSQQRGGDALWSTTGHPAHLASLLMALGYPVPVSTSMALGHPVLMPTSMALLSLPPLLV